MLTSSSSSSSSSSYPSSSSSAPSFHSATMTHDQRAEAAAAAGLLFLDGASANTGLETVLPQRITVLSSGTLPRHAARLTLMMHIIDNMGEASARAQGLRSPVTNLARLHQNPLHRLYVLRSGRDLGSTIQRDARPTSASRGGGRCDPSEGEETFLEAEPPGEVGADVIGMLKVGPKNLFVANRQGRQIQMCPLCVLDFFIHEKFQRSGFGKELFDFMLEAEGTSAELLAYDKPSRLLLSFLRKHYNLEDYTPQANNFVIFKQHPLASDPEALKGRKQRNAFSPHRDSPRPTGPAAPALAPAPHPPRHHRVHASPAPAPAPPQTPPDAAHLPWAAGGAGGAATAAGRKEGGSALRFPAIASAAGASAAAAPGAGLLDGRANGYRGGVAGAGLVQRAAAAATSPWPYPGWNR